MLKGTVVVCIASILLISCISANAKQPVKPASSDRPDETFIPEKNTGKTFPVSLEGSSVPRKHHGPVLALAAVSNDGGFFSAGQDGFLSYHADNNSVETWQISDIPLRAISVNPDGNLVAIYESDGFSIYRISVWNWKTKTRLYAKRFRDSVISLSWSAKGSLLMIGNTSIEGITILDRMTGNPKKIFRNKPGIVSLGITGTMETSMITFGPSGRILYTDIPSGKELANYIGEHDLQHPVLIDNNTKIAGYRDDSIMIIDATSGKTLETLEAHNPIMTSRQTDTNPVWLERTTGNEWVMHNGAEFSTPFVLPDKSEITAALGFADHIVIGSGSGNLYTISSSFQSDSVPQLKGILNEAMQPIDDIVSDGSRLFLLSSGSVFISEAPDKLPVLAFDGINANRMTILDCQLLFWSSNSAEPVTVASFNGELRKTIYRPADGIRSLSVYGSHIAFVEGTSIAHALDTASSESPYTYTGAGLQDAVLISENRVIVSKSATPRSPYPVLLINFITGETVPVPVQGDLCFGLRLSIQEKSILNGFIVKDSMPSSTDLVTLQIDTTTVSSSTFKREASYQDEDLVATQFSDGKSIFTNLGKGSIVEIPTDNGKHTSFERGYALPSKITLMDRFIVTLNYDGSLTWYDRNSRDLLSVTSITPR